MDIMKTKIVLLLSVLLFACQNKKRENTQMLPSFELHEIAVNDSLNNHVEQFLLSDVIEDIDIVPLEMDEKYLYRKINKIIIGKNDIFLCGSGNVLRYNREGKLICSIGRSGNGPEDHIYPGGIGIDEEARIIYVFCGDINQIKAYNYDGEFIKSTTIAAKGAHMTGTDQTESRTYLFLNGKHLFRRMLPAFDGSKDPWLIQVHDTSGTVKARFYDPANEKNHKGIKELKEGFTSLLPKYWNEDSPALNSFHGKVNILFDSNDTIYQYQEDSQTLIPRFILLCGERPDIEEIRSSDKDWSFFDYTLVTDVLETNNYLFLVAEKGANAFLLRISKKDGSIQSIQKEGELIQSKLMKAKYRKAYPPGFTNDLCGGLPFYPDYQDEKRWIAKYSASDLIEKIDIEKLKNTEVLFPDKRDKLVRIIQNLKEDDNPVLIISTIKQK